MRDPGRARAGVAGQRTALGVAIRGSGAARDGVAHARAGPRGFRQRNFAETHGYSGSTRSNTMRSAPGPM